MRIISIILLAIMSFFYTVSLRAADIHWTLSSSPIIINEDFFLEASDRLIIEPGVEVRFNGYFNLILHGQIIAKGTAEQPIKFKSHDTTGFSNNYIPNGGWKGILSIPMLEAGPDSFIHCHFSDLKLQNYSDNISLSGAVYIDNCLFFNNTSPETTSSATLLQINHSSTALTHKPILKDCQFHDNHIRNTLIEIHSNLLSFTNCSIRNNTYGYGLKIFGYESLDNTIDIGNNDFRNNKSEYMSLGGNGPAISVFNVQNLEIKNNTIYNNTSTGTAALISSNSYGYIDNNIFANNVCWTAPGSVYCVGYSGGLVQLSGGADSFKEVTPPIFFRNNIIANNYTFNFGHLTMHYINAEITNNNFVNNSSEISAPSIYVWGDGKNYFIKNNIFNNNITKFLSIAQKEMRLSEGNVYNINANIYDKYLIHSLVDDEGDELLITLEDDTLANIYSSTPMFTSVILDTATSINALEFNFSLAEGSPCIDAGSASDITLSDLDYDNLPRVVNTIVDIGAIEYTNIPTRIEDADLHASFTIYPNPSIHTLNIAFPLPVTGSIEIITIDGKYVKGVQIEKIKNVQIAIGNLSPSTYILRIIHADGRSENALFIKHL